MGVSYDNIDITDIQDPAVPVMANNFIERLTTNLEVFVNTEG